MPLPALAEFIVGDGQVVHGFFFGPVGLAEVEGALPGQVGDEEGVLRVGAREVAASGGAVVTGKRTDQDDPGVLPLEVGDERGPEVAAGLDGEDKVLGELVAGQFGQRGRQARLELSPELIVVAGVGCGEGEGCAEGQAVGVEDLGLVLGFGGVDADEEASGDEVALLLEFLERVSSGTSAGAGEKEGNR